MKLLGRFGHTTSQGCVHITPSLSPKKHLNESTMGVPVVAQRKRIQLGTMRLWVLSLASLSGLGIWRCVSCVTVCRRRLDPALLWLWHRLAAVALIWPLAWELSHATGLAKKQTKNSIYNYSQKITYLDVGIPVVAQLFMNPTSIHEDSDLIPRLSQWITDPVLLWAVVAVADVVQIWCGCGLGWQLQLWFDL